VIDMCGVWCPGATPEPVGSGDCHGQAPLLDKVRVYRVEQFGAVWSTRDIDMFQDTFPIDGTDTGIGRADMAQDIVANSPTILPGDSARVIVNDPTEATPANLQGLQPDNLGLASGRAMYIWVNVLDNGAFNPAKSGAALTNGNPYFFKDTQVVGAETWTRIQCWRRLNAANTFVIDLNDNLFTGGDVVRFFFAATNISGITNYASGSNLGFITNSLTDAITNASEFTILPLNGNGTDPNDVLYVDGMDGRGGQGFFDTAFEQLGYNPDRYDVRGPSSGVANRPSTRVTNVTAQLNANYQKIIWDCGDLTTNLGDGTGTPEASNDYAMLNIYLNALASPGGVYLCGDDLPSSLASAAGGDAVSFKSTYINYNLITGNHRPTYGIAPVGTGTGGGSAFGSDTWVIYGGCGLINDFDVMDPTGLSTVMESTYGTPGATNGAEISQVTGNAKVMLSGYSFIYIRDNETDGVLDRALHMQHILQYLANDPDDPVGTPTAKLQNELKQNYPNPFNPQTTIAFAIQDRGRVKIDVYNVAGELVKTLLDEERAAGAYTAQWDGTNGANQPVSSGVYFYKLVSNNFTQTKKMVLLK
jgi:hypothetical protein